MARQILQTHRSRKGKRAVKFEKYHGIGNDYLVYDCQKNTEELDADKIRKSVTGISGLVQTVFWQALI